MDQIASKKQIGKFECSDALLNSIWKAGVESLAVLMQDYWSGKHELDHSARINMLSNYYIFGDAATAAGVLRGFTENLCGDRLAWLMMLRDYIDYTASGLMVEGLYPFCERLVDGWETPQGTLLSYVSYYKALIDAAYIAARAREFDKAAEWRVRAQDVLHLINNLWDDRKGIYTDGGAFDAQANYLALLFEIADGSRAALILDYLDSKHAEVRSGKPGFSFYIFEALAKAGIYQKALDMIRADANGPSAAYWLMKHIAGIQLPDATNRRPYTIEPKLCDLEWVRARVDGTKMFIAV